MPRHLTDEQRKAIFARQGKGKGQGKGKKGVTKNKNGRTKNALAAIGATLLVLNVGKLKSVARQARVLMKKKKMLAGLSKIK